MTYCTICLSGVTGDIRTLECKHSYHTRCINKWFVEHNACPICRDEGDRKNNTFMRRIEDSKNIELKSETYGIVKKFTYRIGDRLINFHATCWEDDPIFPFALWKFLITRKTCHYIVFQLSLFLSGFACGYFYQNSD